MQAHAHARIFAWLLGTCISETTADIAGNQTPMPEDQRELYTMQTTSAKVSRRQRHRTAKYSAYVNKTHAYFGCKSSISVYTRNLTRRRQQQRVFTRTVLGSVIFNRLPHSFSTQRRLNLKKTLCYGLYLHANIAHTKFERVLNDTDRVLLRNVSLAIWPASCSSQLIKVGVVKRLTTNNLTRERTVVYQLFLFPLDGA